MRREFHGESHHRERIRGSAERQEPRVHFLLHELELERRHRCPRRHQVRTEGTKHQCREPQRGRSDRGLRLGGRPARSAEEPIQEREQKLRLDRHEREARQGLQAHHGNAVRARKRGLQIRCLDGFGRGELDLSVAAQQPGERHLGTLREALADDRQHGQLRAIDALRGEIVRAHAVGRAFLEKGGNLFFRNVAGTGSGALRRRLGAFRLRGHYCTTKLVNRTSSTSSPPCFFWTSLTSCSASARSFSLPSRDMSDW